MKNGHALGSYPICLLRYLVLDGKTPSSVGGGRGGGSRGHGQQGGQGEDAHDLGLGTESWHSVYLVVGVGGWMGEGIRARCAGGRTGPCSGPCLVGGGCNH